MRQKVTLPRPSRALRITPKRALNVVVFKPPPVPEGDAPTTISMMIRNREAGESRPIGIVLNPTVVRALMTWNAAAVSRS